MFSSGALSFEFMPSDTRATDFTLAMPSYIGKALMRTGLKLVWFSVKFLYKHSMPIAISCYVTFHAVEYFRLKYRDFGQVLRSKVIEYFANRITENVAMGADRRDLFRSIDLHPIPMQMHKNNHSHPTAAYIRTQCNHAIDDFVHRCGARVYSVSMSAADVRGGHDGSRLFWRAKDAALPYRNDVLTPDHIVKMSDTSYYLDLPKYLDGHVVVMCELDPNRASSPMADACYMFGRDGLLNEEICGDSTYRHALWNNHHDSIIVPTWCGSWLYFCEKISHPDYPQYRIVGYFPKRFIWAPASWLLDGDRLQRRKVVNGDWASVNTLCVHEGRGVEYTSIARVETKCDAFVPTEVLQLVLTRLQLSNRLDIGGIEGILELESKHPRYELWRRVGQSVRTTATIMVDFFKSGGQLSLDKMTLPTSHTYVPINEHYRPLATPPKDSTRSIVPEGRAPLAIGGVSPGGAKASTASAVKGRITDVINRVVPPPKYVGYAREFVNLVMADEIRGTGAPVSIDEVWDRQARPSQRGILARAGEWRGSSKQRYDTFMKKEIYGAVNYPRMISQVPGDFKLPYSAYMYSFSDTVMKRMRWYAFGRPNDGDGLRLSLPEAVRAASTGKNFVVSTDYSKFDGTVSPWLRNYVESPLLYSYFTPIHASEAVRLHNEQLTWSGHSRDGVHSEPGSYRGSGSPETAIMNSMINAFVSFCAYRNCGYPMLAAWESLGLYGGDDGINFDIEAEVLEKTAKDMGMVLKCEPTPITKPTKFLGLYWFNLGSSHVTCCADLKRQIVKLHLTTSAPDVSMASVMRAKALGLMFTNQHTPILGLWARRVLQLTSDVDGTMTHSDTSWFAMEGVTFEQPAEHQMLEAFAADGISAAKINEVETLLLAADSLESLFPTDILIDGKQPAKIVANLGGEIVRPAEPERLQPAPTPATVVKTKPRKRKTAKSKVGGAVVSAQVQATP